MGFFFDLTLTLNSLSTELLWLIMLLFCFISILIFLKLFGYIGIFIYSIVPIDIAINIADGAFAMMAIPTLISALWLAPKVMQESRNYFKLIDNL